MYPIDIDFVWIGIDKVGHVAAFITAGKGQIPETAMPQVAFHISPEEIILSLPVISSVVLHISYPKMQSLIDLAERGFFVYDWTDIHRVSTNFIGEYELVVTPTIPISVSKLVEQIDAKIFLSAVVGLSFQNQFRLPVSGVTD